MVPSECLLVLEAGLVGRVRSGKVEVFGIGCESGQIRKGDCNRFPVMELRMRLEGVSFKSSR